MADNIPVNNNIIISNDILYSGITANRHKFQDVNLWAENKTIRTHRLLMSIFFDNVRNIYLSHESVEDIYFEDVPYSDLEKLVEFMYTGRLHVNGAQMQSVLKTSKQLRFLPFLQPEVMKYFDNVSLQNVDANASIETYEAVDAQNANPEIVEAMEQSSSAGNEADANNNTINLFDDDETSSDPIQPPKGRRPRMRIRSSAESKIKISTNSLFKRKKVLKKVLKSTPKRRLRSTTRRTTKKN